MSFEMDVDTTEWDAICRICLQEGQMNSIFDYDDEKSDIHIADKIMLCSSIDVSKSLSITIYAHFTAFTYVVFIIATLFDFIVLLSD